MNPNLLGASAGAALAAGWIVLKRRGALSLVSKPVRPERLSQSFNAVEFASRGRELAPGSRELYRALCVKALQPIRDHAGRVILITNGERKRDHNADVDGAPDSRHLPPADRSGGSREGVACDLRVPGYSARQTWDLFRWIDAHAESLGVGGCEFYPKGNFIHIDSRPNRARWPAKSGRAAWESREGVA